jgi:hypothetical protein
VLGRDLVRARCGHPTRSPARSAARCHRIRPGLIYPRRTTGDRRDRWARAFWFWAVVVLFIDPQALVADLDTVVAGGTIRAGFGSEQHHVLRVRSSAVNMRNSLFE